MSTDADFGFAADAANVALVSTDTDANRAIREREHLHIHNHYARGNANTMELTSSDLTVDATSKPFGAPAVTVQIPSGDWASDTSLADLIVGAAGQPMVGGPSMHIVQTGSPNAS
jgi:hypothetical protein